MPFVDKWQWPYGWIDPQVLQEYFQLIWLWLDWFHLTFCRLIWFWVLYQVDHLIEAQVNSEPEVPQHIQVEPISKVILM